MGEKTAANQNRLSAGAPLASSELVMKLNQQIGHELHASHQYLEIAAYFDLENLPKLAGFFYEQAAEEREHAMKFLRFLVDVGASVEIPSLPAPQSQFGSAAEAVRAALQWERQVTDQIYDLVDRARGERSYVTERFLDWFVHEQLEEINTMERLLSLVERAGEKNLLLVEDYVGEHAIRGEGEEANESEGS
jgi:ferritin